MENGQKETRLSNALKFGIFLLLAILIIQIFPSRVSFKYQYEEGKPWGYELLTAPFSFPIRKSEAQLDAERKKLKESFIPYYKIDTSLAEKEYKNFLLDFYRKNGKNPEFQEELKTNFNSVYSQGIISVKDLNDLNSDNIKELACVFPNRLTRVVPLNELYTPKSAYEKIVQTGFTPVQQDLLSSYNLNSFVINNLQADSARTVIAEKELFKNLSLTMGFVQEGERIITKGEVVSPQIFAILNSLKEETSKRLGETYLSHLTASSLARAILVFFFIFLLFLYFYNFRPLMYENYKKLFLIFLLILMIVGLASLSIYFQSRVIHYYMVPYAILPIVIRVFLDLRTAFYVHLITSLVVSLMVDSPFMFLVLQFVAGLIAVFSMKDMVQRSQLAQAAICVFLGYTIVYLCLSVMVENSLADINLTPLFFFALNSLFLLFSYILIFLFEKLFGFISSVTLVELTNVNSNFMMNFAEAAPGTFQHSLQVSNLAMSAAKKINANSLLVRTGALYHDIGKLNDPSSFTENQSSWSENPLLRMDFESAARVIINHVSDGVKIARKQNLPEEIIHFITTHHGTSKVRYFYNSFVNANPDKKPNEAAFSYPGPLPDTKETAILMMADAVEARSRSLKEYTKESISEMVEDMVSQQIAEGQLKNSPLSFRDVETIKELFKQKLVNIYHTRISYPKAKETAEK